MQMHIKETPLEMFFMYLGNKEIYWIFQTCCIVSVLFFTKFYFIILYFFMQMNFFINHALKFKYQLGHVKVKWRWEYTKVCNAIGLSTSIWWTADGVQHGDVMDMNVFGKKHSF
jgi:hypothetical protein